MEDLKETRLDSVITIADSDAMARFPDLGRIGLVQIEMADIILINKTDLAKQRDLDIVREEIGRINPRAVKFETVKCRISPDILFGIGAERKELERHEHSASPFEAFSFSSGDVFEKKKFVRFAGKIPKDIWRAKGFVVFGEGPQLFNYVAGRADFEKWAAEKTELVFIGRAAERHEKSITEMIKKCRKH